MSKIREEQMLQQMLAQFQGLADTLRVESKLAEALRRTGVEALDSGSETTTSQPHSPFIETTMTDKTLTRAIPSSFSITSISWVNAMLTCRWDRYKAKWEFSARVPLPRLMNLMFFIRIAAETRVRQWGFENIKISALRFMSSVGCTNELWQACASGNLQQVQVLVEEKRCDPYSLLDFRICSCCVRPWDLRPRPVCVGLSNGDNLLVVSLLRSWGSLAVY